MKLTLRDYQIAQCSAVYREARAGRGRTVINSPVGSGKSAVIAELCRRAKKPLVISPALSVLDQLSANLSDWLEEFVDVEQGVPPGVWQQHDAEPRHHGVQEQPSVTVPLSP